MRIADWMPGHTAHIQGERARLLAAWAEGLDLGMEIADKARRMHVSDAIDLLNATHRVRSYAEGGGLGLEPPQEDVDRVLTIPQVMGAEVDRANPRVEIEVERGREEAGGRE